MRITHTHTTFSACSCIIYRAALPPSIHPFNSKDNTEIVFVCYIRFSLLWPLGALLWTRSCAIVSMSLWIPFHECRVYAVGSCRCVCGVYVSATNKTETHSLVYDFTPYVRFDIKHRNRVDFVTLNFSLLCRCMCNIRQTEMKVVLLFRSGAGFYQDFILSVCARYILCFGHPCLLEWRIHTSKTHSHEYSSHTYTSRAMHDFVPSIRKVKKNSTRCKHMVNDTYSHDNQPIYVASCVQKPIDWL